MKVLTGKIVSQKTPKTVVVTVERFYAHPLYGKRVRKTKRYHVHHMHAEVETKIGDIVQFVETRPISKTKRWKLVKGGKA